MDDESTQRPGRKPTILFNLLSLCFSRPVKPLSKICLMSLISPHRPPLCCENVPWRLVAGCCVSLFRPLQSHSCWLKVCSTVCYHLVPNIVLLDDIYFHMHHIIAWDNLNVCNYFIYNSYVINYIFIACTSTSYYLWKNTNHISEEFF